MTIQARRIVKDARVEIPSQTARVRVLGVSIGREDHLAKKTEEHQVVIDRIPLVQDLQSAWLVVVLLRRVPGDVLVEVSHAFVDR